MNSLIPSLTLAASLVLGPTLLEAVPDPLRLWTLPVARFVTDEQGKAINQRGQLDSFGQFKVTSESPVPELVVVPPAAMNRTLVSVDSWIAYGNLGPEAVANFVADIAGVRYTIGFREYLPVSANPDARFDLGDAVNLSARAALTPGGEPVIGGFVVENQARWVLIRVVGPTLAQFGVPTPLADPWFVVHEAGRDYAFLYNDNWNERHDADKIVEVTARIGAFALPAGSKDAAYLYEFPPGAYTVVASGNAGPTGTVLLEIYMVP